MSASKSEGSGESVSAKKEILLTRAETQELLLSCVDDVKRDLFDGIELRPGERAVLLAELDVLNRIKGRIYARCDAADPRNPDA